MAERCRRPVAAVIGPGAGASARVLEVAEAVGRGLVERRVRLVTGGLGGVMEAASRGARSAASYAEGDIVGIIPGSDSASANPFVDIVVPTNMGFSRNVLVVAMSDVVVAVGGGAGTLTEIAMAWQMGKVIIGVQVDGWSGELAGRAVDDRREDRVLAARDAAEAIALAARAVGLA